MFKLIEFYFVTKETEGTNKSCFCQDYSYQLQTVSYVLQIVALETYYVAR